MHSPEAIARRDSLVEATAGLWLFLKVRWNKSLTHFGSKQVAEVTSRKRRLVRHTVTVRVELEKLGDSAQKAGNQRV